MPEESDKQAKLLTVALELLRRSMTDSVAFLFANRDRSTGDAAPWAKIALEDARPSSDTPRPVPQQPNPKAAAQPVKDAAAPPEPKVDITIENDGAKGGKTAPDVVSTKNPKPSSLPNPNPTSPPSPNPSPGISPNPAPTPHNPPTPPTLPPSQGPHNPPTLPPTPPTLPPTQGPSPKLPPQIPPIPPQVSPVSAFDRPQSVIIVGPNPLPVRLDKAMQVPATTPRAERRGGEGTGVSQAMAARFMALVGSLYALSAVLSSAGSGASTFQKSLNLLGSTLAPILMPVFLLLASGIMTLSDIIWDKMLPALGDFYKWILKFALPIAAKSTENASNAADAVGNIGGGKGKLKDYAALTDPIGVTRNLADFAKKIPGVDSKLGRSMFWPLHFMGSDAPLQRQRNAEATKEAEQRKAEGKPEMPSFGRRFNENMQMAIESLSKEMGPKASYTGLAEAGKQAQLAALNADPIEMKAAQRVIEAIQEFQRAFSTVANKTEPRDQINRRNQDWGDSLRR